MSATTASARRPRPVRWPWVAVGAFLSIATAANILVRLNGESLASQVPFVIAFAMFGVVGALVLSRDPRNRIGGLLLYGSFATAVSFLAGELVTYLASQGRTTGPFVVAVGMASDLGWLLGIMPVLYLLPLLFPDGRLPSASWRPLAWVIVVFLGLAALLFPLGTEVFTGSSGEANVANPLYVPAVGELGIPDAAFNLLLLALMVASVASIVVRFRHSRGVERQQIKWVAFAVLLLLVSFVASLALPALGLNGSVVDAVFVAPAFLALPVSVGIAVLQFHLYDLDVVVKKALVAGTLALFAIFVYAAVVYLVGRVTTERESSGWVFAMALVLGLAFRPAMRVARRVADRFVYGRRATPYEVLTEFSERVGGAYATDDVLGRMAQILAQGVGASGARVWLVVGGQLRPVGSCPEQAPVASEVDVRDDALPQLPGESAVEVRDRGELLGALSVIMPPSDPMTPAKERLVRDLASHAGLALRNVRLVKELKASQRRIVTAQDGERRRLERNIHDGAQQQLVALTVKTRLARQLTDRDPAKAAEMLEQVEAETQAALEDLRALARGIYPPLLADKGLPTAFEAQARRSPIPVTIEANGVGRYPPEVEAAMYFSVLEALQNTAKYAQASRATVVLTQTDGHLEFAATDDGGGFDPSSTGYGTGLQGIADRLAALEGTIAVTSSPGAGTRVMGRIPVADAER